MIIYFFTTFAVQKLIKIKIIMKRKLTLLLLTLPMMLSAQTILTYATHGMQEGDVLTLTKLTNFNVGNGGANQVWDFSNAQANGSETIDYNANPTANNNAGKAFACLMDKKTTKFHSVSSKEKLYYGLSTNNSKIEFETPIKEMAYPFQYQSQISGEMKGTYTSTPSGRTETIDGNYSVTADGYGTLILPNGVTLKNVLRVVYLKDYAQTMGDMQYYVTVKHYLYYAAESRYPVLQVNDVKTSCDCACNSNSLTACYNANVAQNDKPQAVPEIVPEQAMPVIAPDFNYTLYPNPAKTELRVDYNVLADAKIKISIIDIAGKKIETIVNKKQELGAYSIAANVENLTNGVYVLEIQVNGKVYTETFIKQ